MVLELIFGLMILAVVALVLFRIIGNVALGAVLILAIFASSYLLVGSFPNLGGVPIIGDLLPKTGKAIAVVKDLEYSMEIIGVSKTGNDNLLVSVANTGKSDLSNFTGYVDNKQAAILNGKDSLESGSVYVFELDWVQDYRNISIKSGKTEAISISN